MNPMVCLGIYDKTMFAAITFTLALSGLAKSIPIDTRDNSSNYPVKDCSAFYNSPYSAFSCGNSSAVPSEYSCCFEKDGVIMQTQFWDYDKSSANIAKRNLNGENIEFKSKRSGEPNVFTIHGLWDDKCDGSYETFCDSSLELADSDNLTHIITDVFGEEDLYNKMVKYWLDESGDLEKSQSLWEHEYNKHGTCMNTLNPSCFTGSYQKFENTVNYYKKIVELWESLPTYDWLQSAGITPSTSKQYSLSDVQDALNKNHDGKEVYVGCEDGAINQIYYYYNVKGSVLTGTYQAIDTIQKSSCPDQVYYLPK